MRKRIGSYLVEKGAITEMERQEILKYSRGTGMRFGDAGLALKLLTHEKLIDVFGPSFAVDYFHLDATYYPAATRELLPLDLILRSGALPLGFKNEHRMFRPRRMLNVGMLDPGNRTALREVETYARQKLCDGPNAIHGLKVFLILADQFIDVLRAAYGVDDARLNTLDEGADETLLMFLERPESPSPGGSA